MLFMTGQTNALSFIPAPPPTPVPVVETLAQELQVKSPTKAPILVKPRVPEDAVNKNLSFVFNTGTLLHYNPAHVWVMITGQLKSGSDFPMEGVGITVGYTHMCDGVAFEVFQPPSNYFPDGCIEIDWQPHTSYEILLAVKDNKYEVRVDGRSLSYIHNDFSPQNLYRDTVIGIAGNKNYSECTLSNIREEVWTDELPVL